MRPPLAVSCLFTALLTLAPSLSAQAGGAATVREYQAEFTTYPFSDPNPIPVMGRIYPYFRFDGFTDVPVKRTWKVIDLENRWIRVSILPEIGGKIWRAIDKATGKSFIYDNHVVKFRDIAMRGPWTSGGIEANYGIIGHTANVATPVDYVTHQGADGSVTCTIGTLDLLTRTSWRLAITLPADKAYFMTSSFWHNGTPFEQPYYSWMNAAIPVGEDLEFIYPGNHFLGHGGEVGDWPVNRANGKAVSSYRNNDFGGAKSYHVFGSYADFFGAYWHAQDFGMARYAPHDEKPGKKLWIWGLSRQGMIWEQLLTDADGQYSEVQSGRLFNQTGDASTLTPFKHRGFAPYTSDRWTEYWFPVKGTDGFVTANSWGALNVQPGPRGVVLSFSPVQQIADSIEVFDGSHRIYAQMLRLDPLQRWRDTAPAVADPKQLRVTLGGYKVNWSADTAATSLGRPVAAPAGFDWNSAYGKYLSGKEKERERDYAGAQRDLERAVAVDPNYLPALVDLASLALRRGDGAGALRFARRALSVDTYDPAANFAWGEANLSAGRRVDARDGFDIASQSPEYRSAASTALAKIYLRDGNLERAIDYAAKALDYNRYDLDAWQVRAVAHRLRGDQAAATADIVALEVLDPLSHFAHFESALWDGTDAARHAATALIRNEMPVETLLELGLWYVDVGQLATADQLFDLAPPNPEALYWRAFVHDHLGEPDVAMLLAHADTLSPRLVFPSRIESADVMAWAMTRTTSWLPRYFLGLIRWSQGDSAAARTLFDGIGERPSFAPFYAARAELLKTAAPARALADLRRAVQLEPDEWRYGRLLAERRMADSQVAEAVGIAAAYYGRFPRNSALGMLYARALLRNGDATAARQLLDTLVVLPFEGSGEAHSLYREANLLGAVERIRARDPQAAAALIAKAREWPERLGAGKPYDKDVDERLEDLLSAWARRGSAANPDLDRQVKRALAASPDLLTERVLRALTAPVGTRSSRPRATSRGVLASG
jgi:tetratricopeptide (TPR) repeat protein